MGRTKRFIKVKAQSGQPLNEAADALAAAAAETDPARDVELGLNPEAVHFLIKGKWVEWGMNLREDLTQNFGRRLLSSASVAPFDQSAGEGARRECRLPCGGGGASAPASAAVGGSGAATMGAAAAGLPHHHPQRIPKLRHNKP